MSFFQDGKHEPTPRRRLDARRQGQIPKSTNLANSIVLVGATTAVVFALPKLAGSLRSMTTAALRNTAVNPTDVGWLDHLQSHSAQLGTALLPLLGLMVLLVFVSHWIQMGWVFLPHRIVPNFARLGSAEAWGRIFSVRNLHRLLITGLSLLLGGYLIQASLRHAWQHIGNPNAGLVDNLAAASDSLFHMVIVMGLGQLLIGALDYVYQRREHEHSLMMTDEEKRAEVKSVRNDPSIRRQRQLYSRQYLQARSKPPTD